MDFGVAEVGEPKFWVICSVGGNLEVFQSFDCVVEC